MVDIYRPMEPAYIIASRNYTSRRLIEKISQIQLRLFQVEKVYFCIPCQSTPVAIQQPFWFRRTAKKLRNLQPDEIYFPTAVYNTLRYDYP